MKNLVLSALVAAVASQAAGCIIIADDNEPDPTFDNQISATWNYKRVGVTQQGCPGANGVRLMVKSETTGVTDAVVFNCSQKILVDYFPNDRYSIWVEITANNQPYAKSVAVQTDIFDKDVSLTFDIHEDKGYFQASWSLTRKSNGALLTCAQVPGLSKMTLDTVRQGTTIPVNSPMDCEPGNGFTQALETGFHTGTYYALNAQGQALNAPVNRPSLEILPRNQVTVLGSVVIPIDGL